MLKIIRNVGGADKLRKYQIYLDGKEIGVIGQNETKQFSINDGSHKIQLRIDWCTSEEVIFDMQGKPVTFECGSQSAMKAVASALFKTKSYIWLNRIN